MIFEKLEGVIFDWRLGCIFRTCLPHYEVCGVQASEDDPGAAALGDDVMYQKYQVPQTV